MRITKVDIPQDTNGKDGLDSIRMNRLESVVLISGKNGAGKTRILNKIIDTLSNKLTTSQIEEKKRLMFQHRDSINSLTFAEKTFKNQLKNATDQVAKDRAYRQLDSTQKAILELNEAIPKIEGELLPGGIETSELAERYKVVRFLPKELNLRDPHKLSPDLLEENASKTEAVGIEKLTDSALAKIQYVQNLWFNSTHPDVTVSQDVKTKAIENYKRLKHIIEIFLNSTLGRNEKGQATIFDFPIGEANLSDGQKILLQFCVAIFSQESALNDLILIFDEPENHLHPSAIIEVLDRVQKANSNGQIWISTHSIPILSHFDPSALWFVDKGKISHAGKTPEIVLQTLLGDESEISKLQSFIGLPEQFATDNFAVECLYEPITVMTSYKDPQASQIRNELLRLIGESPLKVLDFGTGQGRLIANIHEQDQNGGSSIIEKIDYIAFDLSDKDKEQCVSSISTAYGDATKRYYNDRTNLLSDHNTGTFDVVIMCNVLHEIDPANWYSIFSSDGLIFPLLKENGSLLLVEDYQMPVGEMAYQKGFLVLDTPQLKQLFKITEADTGFKYADYRGDGRLKAHLIPKNCLNRVNNESKKESLKNLSSIAKDKILAIRKSDKNYKNGKLHGFWTQQFANAQLSLDELS